MDDSEFVIVEDAVGNRGVSKSPYLIPPAGLDSPMNTSADQQGDHGYYEHSIAKKGKKIEIFVKVMEINAGIKMDKSKTIGTITTRNGRKILMTAHSGYSTNENCDKRCLDTKKWNFLALHHLAKQIGFRFPTNIRDSSGGPILYEHRGRAHAGHVEVLLACWYVVDALRTEFKYIDKTEEWLITQLKRLRAVNLHDKRTALITIDSQPCRTCLQFLNKLSQYTRIFFLVEGSRGIGPIQVRVDGERRKDIVGDVFADSEDDAENMEDNKTLEVHKPTTSTSDPPTPLTPETRLVLRRPGSFRRPIPIPWTPNDPQELLSSYKKKTPVYDFPGYNGVHRPSPEGYWENSPSFKSIHEQKFMPGVEENAEAMDGTITDSDLNEWEDLGHGLTAPIKSEQQQFSLSPLDNTQNYTVSSMNGLDGEKFAYSAYKAIQKTMEVEETEYEVVERPENKAPNFRLSSARDHKCQQRSPRLQHFRHEQIDNTNESVFKSRYAILRPKTRFLKYRTTDPICFESSVRT
ncbi:hypothetical protein F5Y12DRAFT_798239 [Xylaria sp. FL1777]|nr:hypothetical protein F5Y12DRAFT_798239 [Xylaria sp. FL1777]